MPICAPYLLVCCAMVSYGRTTLGLRPQSENLPPEGCSESVQVSILRTNKHTTPSGVFSESFSILPREWGGLEGLGKGQGGVRTIVAGGACYIGGVQRGLYPGGGVYYITRGRRGGGSMGWAMAVH